MTIFGTDCGWAGRNLAADPRRSGNRFLPESGEGFGNDAPSKSALPDLLPRRPVCRLAASGPSSVGLRVWNHRENASPGRYPEPVSDNLSARPPGDGL